LKSTHRRYDGNCAFAAAAYNAGPGRVDRWQRQLNGIDMERFIELIPFTETRDYTKQVLANYVFYSYITGKDPVSLSSLAATKSLTYSPE
ncbi:MAG TPA: transglycosylase SLT domain-containing protein, partial [Dissulfurispiraceae bacterium]|nr:transglycosylase SLT domain-containing protein [Dissulfurispiraceae bacterium]